MTAYRSIVWLDHEETEDDEGRITQDRGLRLLHHKTDDGVVWEVPTQESVDAAFGYLMQWENGDGQGEVTTTEPGTEAGAWAGRIERGGVTYILSYHVGLSYIGLSEVLPDDMWCGTCGRTWNDRATPTPSARCPFEYDHPDADEPVTGNESPVAEW